MSDKSASVVALRPWIMKRHRVHKKLQDDWWVDSNVEIVAMPDPWDGMDADGVQVL